MIPDREALSGLISKVHNATAHLDAHASALQLYREARDAAEQCLPGPVGVAVAAVLAEAAVTRAQSPIGGSLGASKSLLALAVAVLEMVPGSADV